MTDKKQKTKVYCLIPDRDNPCHWSDGLSMIIVKNGITLKLNAADLEKIIKSLPRTFGGSY